jgi:hypothetical protein
LVLEYLTRHNQQVDLAQSKASKSIGRSSAIVDDGITAAIKGASAGSKVNILW